MRTEDIIHEHLAEALILTAVHPLPAAVKQELEYRIRMVRALVHETDPTISESALKNIHDAIHENVYGQ